ncbi:hypothetical protein ACFLQX_01710 [Bacteroidota bacterium]
MERKLHILSWILVAALVLPLFQQLTDIPHKRKLRGYAVIAEVPEFSWKDWFDGSFQPKAEKALNDRFGFRRTFVMVNNQVAFSLYGKVSIAGLVVGKENYFYEKNYIKAYYGSDYRGDSIWQDKARKLKVIQDSLAARGTQLLVTIAAGKGSFYPEYFPDSYLAERGLTERGPTNGGKMGEFFTEEGVNLLDFNTWFVQMKDTSRYCLYPRTGIHWSVYGMALAADSLIRRSEELTGMEIAPFEWSDVEVTNKYRSSDRDIEDGLNLIFRVNRDPMAYPDIQFPEGANDSVKAIIIGDSFFWGMYNMSIIDKAFHESEFWYYYKRSYAKHFDEFIEFADVEVDKLAKFEEADIIILMTTEATHILFPWGFADEAYTLLTE